MRGIDCQILTIGQYLRPSLAHLPMERYYTPEEFRELKRIALELGFGHVESGPLVRSSYHAHEQADSYTTKTRSNQPSATCCSGRLSSVRHVDGSPPDSGPVT